ncbi:MAG: DUF1292 domain-containing protein, partial [Clostridia bacterium]|nr:DUF1292 domain-containing protein [Clostridia bacterium]
MDDNKDYEPDIVSVVDEDGKEHIFEELDRIETEDGRYVALLPAIDDPQEMLDDSGELIILKVIEEDGETFLSPIEDETEFNEIGQLFEDLDNEGILDDTVVVIYGDHDSKLKKSEYRRFYNYVPE